MKYISSAKKWNGWGHADKRFPLNKLNPDFLKILSTLLEKKEFQASPSTGWKDISIPDTRLSPAQIKYLRKISAVSRVSTNKFDRIVHSRGRSLPDLICLRSGVIDEFPDAIVYPVSRTEIAGILDFAQKHKMAVIPYGGGSSVVGGVNSIKLKKQNGILVVNMERMNRMQEIDETSMTATFECGISGPDVELALNPSGYTLGHFPQSFEFSTLGGWLAARGAGYFSGVYGKAENMLVCCSMVTVQGILQTRDVPAPSEGPDLNQLIVGSEGTLGIIAEATVKIHRLEKKINHKAWLFPDYHTGILVLRRLRQVGIRLHMARLSDPEETRYFSQMNNKNEQGGRNTVLRLQKKILFLFGYKSPVVMLTVGEPGQYYWIKKKNIFNKIKYISLGEKPVTDWFASRYELPYLRDELLNVGIAADTFETSVLWSRLEKLRDGIYSAVQKVEKKTAIKYLLMSHVSHTCETGAALYFTIIYPLSTEPLEQWGIMKKAVTDAILKHGGALSHHHGIGTDHLPMLKQENDVTYFFLQSLKKDLDPEGILNPGKLV